jgi:hypothetical protein
MATTYPTRDTAVAEAESIAASLMRRWHEELLEADVQIKYLFAVNSEQWDEWSDDTRRAIIDHELHHIEVRRNQAGAIIYDDANRPKVKLRLHDFNFGGFNVMVARHGAYSAEAESVNAVRDTWVQMQFEFEKVA